MKRSPYFAFPAVSWAYGILLLFSGAFLFWLGAFMYNGLYTYSYDDIDGQRTSGVSDWPFEATSGLPAVASSLVLFTFVMAILARFVIPIVALLIIRWTVFRWSSFSQAQRCWYGGGCSSAALAVFSVWSPLSWSVFTWMLD